MAEAEVRKEPLLLFTEVKDQHEGRFSSLSIIPCKNLAVAVNMTTFGEHLCLTIMEELAQTWAAFYGR